MSELVTLVRAARALQQDGKAFVLATVVRVEGSSYRRPGARMLLTDESWVAGSVSGGCLEGDVMKRAWASGAAASVVSYDLRSDDELSWGLGCQGLVEVLLERVPAGSDGVLGFAARCIADQCRGVRAVIVRAPDAADLGQSVAVDGRGRGEGTLAPADRNAWLLAAAREALAGGDTRLVQRTEAGATVEALLEVIVPPLRLFVFGTGHDALPLVLQGQALGWEVAVCDVQARWSTRERFVRADALLLGPLETLVAAVNNAHRAAGVVLSHNFAQDRDYLGALLGARTVYLGVLGPRRRTERLLAELDAAGSALTLEQRAWLHAPLGLDLGAESPAEIALATLAEIQSVLTASSAEPLRDRNAPLHASRQAPNAPCEARGVKLVTAILAAGGSRRLGTPKQLVALGGSSGEPLVRRTVREVLAAALGPVAVVVGSGGVQVAAALGGCAVTVLDNPDWQAGLAASIHVAAAWADAEGADGLLLTVCDQPALRGAHLGRLAAVFGNGVARVGSSYGGTTGVPAIFGRAWFAELRALTGDRGARDLLCGESVVSVPFPEGIDDIDTPSDVARWQGTL